MSFKTKKFTTDNKTVLGHPVVQDFLIYDLETDSLNTQEAQIKWIGAYSYKHKKYYVINGDDLGRFQDLIDEHKILIGFNNKSYDNEVLEANGFNLDYKIIFDCYRVVYNPDKKANNRKAIIKTPDGTILDSVAKRNTLKTLCEAMGFPVHKGDIDYKLFRQDTWSESEVKEIENYLYKDILLTRLLFEYFITYFDGFRDLVDYENIRKLNYIRSSTGSFAYSVICNLVGLPLEFGDHIEKEDYEGGFVLEPQEKYAEDVVCFDFSSLYPSIEIQCNLFSPVEENSGWDGDEFFKTFGVYNCKERGEIETKIYDIFKTRNKLKKAKDPRELGYKITINSLYGISSSPVFKSIYNPTVAKDTTAIGRQCLQYAVKEFNRFGFTVIYGDTDSCYVKLNCQSIDSAKAIAACIVHDLQEHMPFPIPEFELGVDAVIKKIWFTKKKHYAYITSEDKLVIKGHEVIKGNASMLGQKMLKNMKHLIIERQNLQFIREDIEDGAMGYIEEDITIIGQVYNVKHLSQYKALSSIQAQISAVHGEGSHILIPNKKLGKVGKSKLYCTVEEASTLSIDDLELGKFWNEMAPFIKSVNKIESFK